MTPQQVTYLVILVAALLLLVTEKLRNDIVALLIVLALYVSGILKSEEALAGFGSQPAIVVAAIFVLTSALHSVGLSDLIGAQIGRLAGRSYARMIALIMPSVALLSAFTHHVTTTAVMLPVTLNLSRERGIPASKLLMPLSFAASLGTTITIIGAPAFLVASDSLQRVGRAGLGVFDIAPIGLALSLAGTLFMLVAGRFLLPSREGAGETGSHFRLDNYFTELVILPDSPFLAKTLAEVKQNDEYEFTVVGWLRNGQRLRRPFNRHQIEAGDVLMVRTTPEDLVAFRQQKGIELHPIAKYGETQTPAAGADGKDDASDQFVQAILAPNADLIGRSLGEIDFRRRYGAVVVGLWRQQGWLQQALSKIRLREGDVLLMQGDDEALARVANDRNFLMLVPFQSDARPRRRMRLAGLIMLATVVTASLNWLTLEMAALAGAVAMVLTGCVSLRQAYRSIDARIYVFIAGAIPLGAAMEKSKTAELLAHWLQGAVSGLSEVVILLIIFTIVAFITQLMSDAATTALFAPVAIALAQALGHPPEAYAVTVAMAAVAAFLTPIGHHGNLLVYGPGRYQFGDFVKVGTPLTIVVALVVAIIASMLWRS